MNIKTNFIDFRNEHRIYLLDGALYELFGMIAVTDLDDLDNDGMLRMQDSPSPKTRYKFIIVDEQMLNGGIYEEGELPSVFAHRGDTIKIREIMNILLLNIYFHNAEPIDILKDLSDLDLTVDVPEPFPDIEIRIAEKYDFFSVDTNLSHPIMYFSIPKKGENGVTLSINGYEDTYSLNFLATRIGEIIHDLRVYFNRPEIKIKGFSMWDSLFENKLDVPLPEGFENFLRLVEKEAVR